MKLISACLAGIPCRYDGKSKPNAKIMEMVKRGEALLVCPEQLGGLPIPRVPAEQRSDKVFAQDGRDVTQEFELGAQRVLEIVQKNNCKEAILKARSPSCGCGQVYDGTFSKKLIVGDRVLTKLLKKSGIKVITEESI